MLPKLFLITCGRRIAKLWGTKDVVEQYSQIFVSFASRPMLEDIGSSTFPSVHWETGYCIKTVLESGGIRESLVQKQILLYLYWVELKNQGDSSCSKPAFSKELENKEMLQLNINSSKGKLRKKNMWGFPVYSYCILAVLFCGRHSKDAYAMWHSTCWGFRGIS